MKRKQRLRLQDVVKLCVVGAAAVYMVSGISDVAEKAAKKASIQSEAAQIIALPVEKVPPEPVVDAVGAELITLEYPYNAISADWDGEQIDGFTEFSIPENCAEYGGYLPLTVQEYAWCVCKSYDADYAMILALIERETGYRNDVIGTSGEVGYMQVTEKWHRDRMDRLNVDNLADPYMNILVGVDYISELLDQYQDAHLALSIYNRGFRNSIGTGALDLWERGETSTEYSESIMNRAGEIREELLGREEG